MWQLYRLFLREGIVLFGKIINFVAVTLKINDYE